MKDILNMLVVANEYTQKVLANEKAKIDKINKEKELLEKSMTDEIVKDLRELAYYHKKLGIKKSMFETSVIIKDYNIGLTFLSHDNGVLIEQYENGCSNARSKRIFFLDECYREKRLSVDFKDCWSTIYRYWHKIKHDVEKEFLNAYHTELNNKCKNLEEDVKNALIDLEKTRNIINVRNYHFLDDEEKMRDFCILSKEEFLFSYSYLTEEEYDNTAKILMIKLGFDAERN